MISYQKVQEFDGHGLVVSLYSPHGDLAGFIAVHKGSQTHPSFGATRIAHYSNHDEALKDVLRLSRLMSYKSALAGFSYGGAKAVLFHKDTFAQNRAEIIKRYVGVVNYLRGSFITGADVGVTLDDLLLMKKNSSYIVGLTVDPVHYTVLGILHGIDVCLEEVFGTDDVSKRSFAIQGLGKIGGGLVRALAPRAEKIFVCDPDEKKIEVMKKEFPNIVVVTPSEIFSQKADVYCPAAFGNVFTSESLPQLACSIIAGGANNQLQSNEVGDNLFKNGILYAPDYVINAGGLISVVEEYEHPNINEKALIRKVDRIKETLRSILSDSKRLHKPTHRVADALAEKRFATFE
jgi:leucine dehydrogenase